MIEAAGGLVWRLSSKGFAKVLLIHRPSYDDWSFPKGKLDDGESHVDAAVREVAEETGLRCRLGDELPEVRYKDRKSRPKRVRYWMMEPLGGAFEPNAEVDEVRWERVGSPTLERLSYEHDRGILVAAGTLLAARHPDAIDLDDLRSG